jgi:hypothetical protein
VTVAGIELVERVPCAVTTPVAWSTDCTTTVFRVPLGIWYVRVVPTASGKKELSVQPAWAVTGFARRRAAGRTTRKARTRFMRASLT